MYELIDSDGNIVLRYETTQCAEEDMHLFPGSKIRMQTYEFKGMPSTQEASDELSDLEICVDIEAYWRSVHQ